MLVSERGGLLLAEEAAAPRPVRDALKRVDPGLILGCEVDVQWGCYVWRVLLRQGDRPAVWLFDWRENLADPRSKPRPLTMGIVEEADAFRLDSRRKQVDPVAENDRLDAEAEVEAEEQALGIAREVVRRPRSPVHRSQGLRRARDKARRRGENV